MTPTQHALPNSFKTTLLRPIEINGVFVYIFSRSKSIADMPTHQSACLLSLPSIIRPPQTFPSLLACSRLTIMCVLSYHTPPTSPNCIICSRLNPRGRPQKVGAYTHIIRVPTTQHLDYAPRLLSRALFVVARCLRCECARLWDCLCVVACWYVYIRQYAGRSRVIGVYTFVCVRFFVCPCRVVV